MPCPFCGGEATLRPQGNAYTKSRKITVKCKDCRVELTHAAIHYGFDWLAEKIERDWNRRAAPQPQGGALTDEQIREVAVDYCRFVFPGVYSIREFDCEEDFFNCVRAIVAQSAPSAPQQAGDGLTVSDYEAAFADHQRVVRELDVLLNGDAAAKQASLCDIVSQVRKEGIRSRGVALTEKQTTDLHSHMMNVAMTAWREEADAVVGSSVRSRLRAVVKALAAAPKIRADLSAAPRQPGEMGARVQRELKFILNVMEDAKAGLEPNAAHRITLGKAIEKARAILSAPTASAQQDEREAPLSELKQVTQAPEVSGEHILALARKCKIVGHYATKEYIDALTGFVRVVLNDNAVQEAFVRANAHVLAQQVQADAGAVAAGLLDALRFYANGSHFTMHDSSAWDTVSGEPPNFYEDESNTATVEDGSIAKLALQGKFFTDQEYQEPLVDGEVFNVAHPSPAGESGEPMEFQIQVAGPAGYVRFETFHGETLDDALECVRRQRFATVPDEDGFVTMKVKV